MQGDSTVRNKELFKSWYEKMSLQVKTLIHTLHISDAKWIQQRDEHPTRGQ